MKVVTLFDLYEIVKMEQGGEKLQISTTKEGLREKDIIFLANHPGLENIHYEVVKIWKMDDYMLASLVKVPVPSS